VSTHFSIKGTGVDVEDSGYIWRESFGAVVCGNLHGYSGIRFTPEFTSVGEAKEEGRVVRKLPARKNLNLEDNFREQRKTGVEALIGRGWKARSNNHWRIAKGRAPNRRLLALTAVASTYDWGEKEQSILCPCIGGMGKI